MFFFPEDSDLNFGRKIFDYGFDLRPIVLDVRSEMIFGKFSVPSKNPNSQTLISIKYWLDLQKSLK